MKRLTFYLTSAESVDIESSQFQNSTMVAKSEWANVSSLIALMERDDADYFVLIDGSAEVSISKLEEEMQAFIDQDEFGLFCLQDAAFLESNNSSHFLPTPYFTMLRRELFLKHKLELSKFESLEYALLCLGIWEGRKTYSKPLAMAAEGSKTWMGNRLHTSIGTFANDFSNVSSDIKERLPAQFKIVTHDRPSEFLKELDSVHHELKFSIICPVFKPDFLDEMIASVVNQEWMNWELILGVDGPVVNDQEEILNIISRYSDARITHFVQENRGTGPTRERLRNMTKGDFIISIDDDDRLTPITLEVFAKAIFKNPELKIFRGGSRIFGLANQELLPRQRYKINGISNDPFEVNQPYVIQRDLLNEIGGYKWDTDLHNAGEDTFLFHTIDQKGIAVGLIPLPLYLRRLSTKNLTLQFEGQQAIKHFENIDRQFGNENWSLNERAFSFDGNFQLYQASYQAANGAKLTLATRFFQYQTLGDLNSLTIDLEVTSRCNAVCGFCPRDAMPDKRTNVSMETVARVAAFVKQFPGTQVVLCGIGESLMHPKLLEIVKTLKGAGATVAMTSNGALLKLDKFKALVDAGLSNFNFSVNAASADVHRDVMGMKNFDKVMTHIQDAIAYRNKHHPEVRMHVSCVVCQKNEHEITDFVDFWKSKGISQVWLHPINNRAGLLGANIKSAKIERFAELYKGDKQVSVDIFKDHEEGDNLCKIAKSLAFISSDGEMRLCAMDYKRVTSHGNINQVSLQQMQFEKLKDCVTGAYDDFCKGCDFCPSGIKEKAGELQSAVS